MDVPILIFDVEHDADQKTWFSDPPDLAGPPCQGLFDLDETPKCTFNHYGIEIWHPYDKS